jgi:hypothetical protein
MITAVLAATENKLSCSENSYFVVDSIHINPVIHFFSGLKDNNYNQLDGFGTIVGSRNKKLYFFDYPKDFLLAQNKELLMIIDESQPLYSKTRRTIHYFDSTIALVKNEFTYKHYNKRSSVLDKHPLLAWVKRKERIQLLNLLPENPYSVEQLKLKLSVEQEQLALLLQHYGHSVIEVSLNNFHIDNYGVPNLIFIFKLEVLSGYLTLTEKEKDYVNSLTCTIKQQFNDSFPTLSLKKYYGYKDYHSQALKQLPSRYFFTTYPILFKIGQVLVLVLIGALILFLILGRYNAQRMYSIKRTRSFGKK